MPAEIDLIEALRQRYKSYALCLKEGRRRGHTAKNCTEADFGDKVLPRMRYAPGNHVENAVSLTGDA